MLLLFWFGIWVCCQNIEYLHAQQQLQELIMTLGSRITKEFFFSLYKISPLKDIVGQ